MQAKKERTYPVAVWIISGLLITLLLAACGDDSPTPAPATTRPAVTTTVATTTAPSSPAGALPTANSSTGSSQPATVITTANPNETPPPGAIKGGDGKFYYVVEPVLSFYKANPWLGLPLGGMKEARPDGYDWDGLYQNFQRGRVEAHRNKEGAGYSMMLGLVNQELLKLKG
jgi:hypothetical protein